MHCIASSGSGMAEISPEISTLKAEFQNPPDSSKPLTWWHWMNGNITRDGITKDLEWMKKSGLGGAVVFNIDYPSGCVRFRCAKCHPGQMTGLTGMEGWYQV